MTTNVVNPQNEKKEKVTELQKLQNEGQYLIETFRNGVNRVICDVHVFLRMYV